jgi:hypothetical protein
MKKVEWLTSFMAGLQIAISPLCIGIVAGIFIYGFYPTTTGLVIGIVVAALGLITGVMMARRVWRKRGTVEFISRVSASPELDNFEDDEN